LWGDRERIGQVITNFLTNAIKYSPGLENGNTSSKGRIIVKTVYDRNTVTISVQDFGVGIPKESLDKVFGRFFRVEGSKQATYPGLGLGLYISREIVKRHNGMIWVESSFGKGSIFCFNLPIVRKLKKEPQNHLDQNLSQN
jgi:signal transduction histidine kinase